MNWLYYERLLFLLVELLFEVVQVLRQDPGFGMKVVVVGTFFCHSI